MAVPADFNPATFNPVGATVTLPDGTIGHSDPNFADEFKVWQAYQKAILGSDPKTTSYVGATVNPDGSVNVSLNTAAGPQTVGVDAGGKVTSSGPTAQFHDAAGLTSIGVVDRNVTPNFTSVANLLGNPVGNGLDRLGIGPNAVVKHLTNGRVTIPGSPGSPGGPPVIIDLPSKAGVPTPGGSGGGASNPPPADVASPPTPTFSPNVAPTASRTGTTVTAPPDITAPTDNFRGSLVAGTVGLQAPITSRDVVAPTAVAGQAAQTPAVVGTTFSAPQNNFKAGVTAGTVGVQPAIVAQQVNAPQNNFKGSLVAGQLGAPDKITAQQIGPSITPDQQAAIDLSRAQANGTAPSAAQALLQKGIDQNVGTAYGLAASLSGRNAGQALLQGGANAENAIAKSSADMAALRAQEIATGTERFGALSTSAAGQELTRNTANQSANLTQQVDNIQNTINVLTGNRDAALKAGQSNQADNLTAQIENQKETLSALQGNQTTNLNAQIATVQNTINVLTGNRDAALKAGLQNQADTLTAQIENQKETLATLQSNQSTLLGAATATAANTTNVNVNNAQFRTQASQTNATVGEAASAASSLNNLNAQIQTAQNNITVLTGNRDAALRAGDANQVVNANAALQNAHDQLLALQSNQTTALGAATSTAANQTTLNQADLNSFVEAMKLNSSDRQQINQIGLQAWIEQTDNATRNRAITVAANTAVTAANSAFLGSLIGGLATVGAAAVTVASDRRLKVKVASGDREVRNFLDSLTAKTWDYAHPEIDGEGRRLGPMAQDVAKSDVGRTFVVQLTGGRGLGLDPTRAIGPMLSGLASLNDRLKAMESRQ